MAEQSLSKGRDDDAHQRLHELRTKDPAAASKLATEIVKRMRVEDLVSNYEASGLASQLFRCPRTRRNSRRPRRPCQVVVADADGVHVRRDR
jgi:hypothetical protein